MTKGGYQRRSGVVWFIALALVTFVLYSGAVAAATADDCNGGHKSWNVLPPRWECDVPHTIG